MKYTGNYNLKKPESTDAYNIDDFNYNADVIDEELARLKKLTEVEDISDSFIKGMTDGVEITMKYIYKQGNHISGVVVIVAPFTEIDDGAYFSISDSFSPKQLTVVANTALMNSNAAYTDNSQVDAFISFDELMITCREYNFSSVIVSFSYICKGEEVE